MALMRWPTTMASFPLTSRVSRKCPTLRLKRATTTISFMPWGFTSTRLPWGSAKDEFRAYLIDPTRVPGTLPGLLRKTRSEMGHSEPAGDDATGVSPTRAALGTSARPPTAAAAAADGVVG